jgi:hypothetical protein
MAAEPATAGQGAPQGAGVQPGGQGAPTSSPQPGSNGSGQFPWGMFPNVPEEQRPLLEPHLREVQGHVTRLEEQLAGNPFKDVDAQELAGIKAFYDRYQANPVETWLQMAATLQQAGVLDDDLDVEYLAQVAMGQAPDVEEPQPGQPGQSGAEQEEIPQWGQQIISHLRAQAEREQQQQVANQQAAQKQALDTALGQVKAQLEAAKMPVPTDELLTANIIAHRGNIQEVVSGLTGYRDHIMQGVTQQRQGNQPREAVPKDGTPPTREQRRSSTPGRRRDSFDVASESAAARLKAANEADMNG